MRVETAPPARPDQGLCRRRQAPLPSYPVNEARPDFRPFVARDDGGTLVLSRPATFKTWSTRAALYLLLLLVLGLAALIPYGMWHRYTVWGDVKGLWAAPVLLLLCWFVFKLMLLGFRLEGARRIVCKPGELTLEGRGALLPRREHVRDPQALEARTIRVTTEYGDVRWLRLCLRAPAGGTDIGYLELDRNAEPTREAQVHAAAAQIASRLQVPLDLRGEDDAPLASP